MNRRRFAPQGGSPGGMASPEEGSKLASAQTNGLLKSGVGQGTPSITLAGQVFLMKLTKHYLQLFCLTSVKSQKCLQTL